MKKFNRLYKKKQVHQNKHGDLANSLIEIAVEFIALNKRTDFALRDLSSKLGVSHAAAYRHFKNKQALLEEIAFRGFQKMNKFFKKKLETSTDVLNDMGKAYIDFAINHPGYYRVMFASDLTKDSNLILKSESLNAFYNLLSTFGAKNKKNTIKSIYAWSVVHGFVMLILDGQLATPLADFNLKENELVEQITKTTKKLLELK